MSEPRFLRAYTPDNPPNPDDVWPLDREPGVIIRTGDTVSVTRDGVTKRYRVTRGDSPDTVWKNPAGVSSYEMERIEDGDV